MLGSRSGLAFSGLGGDLKFQSSPGGSLDLKHLGGCSPDSASGCPTCRRRYWRRMASFQASSLYGSRRPHPLPPAAGKVGGGRGRAGGLPRPLRHSSGGRGVIHPSNDDPGIEPGSPTLQADFFFLPTELPGKS